MTPNDVASWQDQTTPMFPGRSQDCGTCVWFPEDNDLNPTSIPPAYALVTVGGLRGGYFNFPSIQIHAVYFSPLLFLVTPTYPVLLFGRFLRLLLGILPY